MMHIHRVIRRSRAVATAGAAAALLTLGDVISVALQWIWHW